MSGEDRLAEIGRRRAAARLHGGAAAVARQHARGRLTIRERIEAMLDPGSFREVGPIAGGTEYDDDGNATGFTPANFVLGFGKIAKRPCVVGGEDYTIAAGSPNPGGLRKSIYTEELACQYRIPLVRLHEGSGGSVTGSAGKRSPAALPEPVYAPHRFNSVGRALATVPVASAALGSVAGLPAVRLVSSHYCVMTEQAQVLVGGPALVERALGQNVSKEALGGAELHGASGVIDDVVADEAAAFAAIRRFLAYLPQNVWELPPVVPCSDDRERREAALTDIVPQNRRRAFDMRTVIRALVDRDSFFEIGRRHGRGQIAGLARLLGHPIGVLANDGRILAGSMTAQAARKCRRFVEFCQTFHLPVLNLVDEPGFMIGLEAEREGTVRAGAAAVLAVAMASIPWASVMVRKSMGLAAAAHYAPNSYILAWPTAESGALPVEGGVAVAFGREIAAADDPVARRAELEDIFASRRSPLPRAEALAVHDLIDPRDTRPLLCDWIERVWPLLQHQLGPTAFTYRP